MSLLQYLIQGSDFGALSRLVSPSFFSVVPVSESLSLLTRVLTRSRDARAKQEAFAQVERCLAPLTVRLGESDAQPIARWDRELGERVLRIYFRQIFESEVWLLDFRKQGWRKPSGSEHAAGLQWSPAPYIHLPSPEFLQAVRSLYRGFYEGNEAEFISSMQALGIQAAESELRAHFGLEEQRAVRFSLSEFQATFAAVFEACRRAKSRIHPEFAFLGAMLLSLYEVLETLGEPLDVRAAFERR